MASDQIKISKVFLDSSVLIAAAISATGSARDLILLSFRNEVKIVVSDLVLSETERNLSKKAPEALPAFELFKEVLNPEIVNPTKSLVLKAAKVVDVKDAEIVAGAVYAKADFLVSFDHKHILKQKKKIEMEFDIKISTPDEVLK